MTQFSKKERLIASLLSATPGLKKQVKTLYTIANSLIYRAGYKEIILSTKASGINTPFGDDKESFFGYYDKTPDNRNGLVIAHLPELATRKKPSKDTGVDIALIDVKTGKSSVIDKSYSYAWQQGCRSQWLNNDELIYNVFENGTYKSKVYSVGREKIIKTYDRPVQDCNGADYFLSINYQRLMAVAPDYGYRNLPLLSDNEMKETAKDGIWKVDMATGDSELLISLDDICNCEHKELFDNCIHIANHVMISKDNNDFIFIHRYYQGKRKFDRLMYFDGKVLKVLVDESMVSHMCWCDDHTVFGYLRYGGKDGFFFCDVTTGRFTECEPLTNLNSGDGHPTCFGDKIVIDTYPDKSRMQHLYLYNRQTNEVEELLQVYQGVKYMYETRCDMHPRFSHDGKRVYFDSVYKGLRQLCYVDLKEN